MNKEDTPASSGPPVKTIGHGTRALLEFLSILKSEGVQRVVDVRSIPRSRHNPQFNSDTLCDALGAEGILYTPMQSLGGLRHPLKNSRNGAWQNKSFRGFADYMQTKEFLDAIKELEDMSRNQTIVLLCAETLPRRCHRSLIADALTVRGHQVEEILRKGHRQLHRLTPWAHVEDGGLSYPPVPKTTPGDTTPPA
jgi:uncharacterized protein (DUF488 family)